MTPCAQGAVQLAPCTQGLENDAAVFHSSTATAIILIGRKTNRRQIYRKLVAQLIILVSSCLGGEKMQADCLPWERRAPARRPCFFCFLPGLQPLPLVGRLPRAPLAFARCTLGYGSGRAFSAHGDSKDHCEIANLGDAFSAGRLECPHCPDAIEF